MKRLFNPYPRPYGGSATFWLCRTFTPNLSTTASGNGTQVILHEAVHITPKRSIPFHTHAAKQAGASRPEVISAILVGLPVAGHSVTRVLSSALAVYDQA